MGKEYQMALADLCSTRNWPPPEYEVIGSLNSYLCTVRVYDIKYRGEPAQSRNQAKEKAAAVAYHSLK
ncbi:hypothetical protein HI914_06723 [Erysiphe necator]|nr:hypothetical protein HI914_06723 [Erysiphe necator]